MSDDKRPSFPPDDADTEPGQYTLTSIAVSSTQYYAPETVLEVRSFIQQIDRLDDPTIRLLDSGAIRPLDLGINTALEQRQIEILTRAKRGDREASTQREHERRVAKIQTRGPVWAEVVKWSLAIGGGIVLTLVAQSLF